MKLTRKPATNTKQFFGREEEYSTLREAILSPTGNTVLVSGDRGSGKTTLINEAIRKIDTSRLYLLNKTVHVEIPLVTTATIDKETLRGLLLRSIIHALNAELKSMRWKRYRSYFYARNLKRLLKRTEYSQITKSLGLNGSLPAHGSNTSIERTWQGTVDLSDIKLELYLTDFMKRYGKKYNLVVVFDELDKYEGADSQLSPSAYIETLKNFFTASRVTYIFVSTESFYSDVQSSIFDPQSRTRTMFTKRILINQITPDAFGKLIDSQFDLDEATIKSADYEQFKLALMWQTNMYPFDLIGAIDGLTVTNDTERYIDTEIAKKSLNEVWRDMAYLLKVVNCVYKQIAKKKDDYFNRYLYTALRETAVLVGSSAGIELNPINPIISLFNADDFPTNGEITLDKYMKSSQLPAAFEISGGWKKQLFELYPSDIGALNDGLLLFAWSMERLSFLDIDTTEKEVDGFSVLSVRANRNLSLKSEAQFNYAINKLKTRELTAQAYIRQLNRISQKYRNDNLDGKVKSKSYLFYKNAREDISKTAEEFLSTLQFRFGSNVKTLMSELSTYEKDLEADFMQRLDGFIRSQPIQEKMSGVTISGTNETGKSINCKAHNGKVFLIYMNLDPAQQAAFIDEVAINDRYIYTIINNSANEYKQSPLFRKFNLNITWSNVDKILSEVIDALAKDVE